MLEHFYKEPENVVRAKVMMLLAQLAQTPGYNPIGLIDDIAAAMKREGRRKSTSF